MKTDKTTCHLCFLGVACHEISSIWNSCVSLQMTLPWGSLSSLKLDCRSQSDDGPIMWVRPGEQMVPTADMPKSPFKRRRYNSICTEIRSDTAQKSYHLKWLQKFRLNKLNKIFSSFSCSFHPHVVFCRSMNEIKNLHYLPRASEPREVLFEDRTKAHADHVGQSFDWQSTAAVGVLKAVHFGEWWLFFSFKNYVKHQCVTSSNGLFCVFMLIINVLQE